MVNQTQTTAAAFKGLRLGVNITWPKNTLKVAICGSVENTTVNSPFQVLLFLVLCFRLNRTLSFPSLPFKGKITDKQRFPTSMKTINPKTKRNIVVRFGFLFFFLVLFSCKIYEMKIKTFTRSTYPYPWSPQSQSSM